MTPLPRKENKLEITFLEDLVKDKMCALSKQERESLLENQQQRAASVGSFDEELLFGSDSDDSFSKDYTITRNTRRRERIIKRDIAVLVNEKKQREQDRLYRAEMKKLKAEEMRHSQALAEIRANEIALKCQSYSDTIRGMTYRDEKRLCSLKEALEPKANEVQRLYARKFVVSDKTQNPDDVSQFDDRETADRATNDDKAATAYYYRDWREIMHLQQESLRSLISLGVVPSVPSQKFV